jgi:hypothetical protein
MMTASWMRTHPQLTQVGSDQHGLWRVASFGGGGGGIKRVPWGGGGASAAAMMNELDEDTPAGDAGWHLQISFEVPVQGG